MTPRAATPGTRWRDGVLVVFWLAAVLGGSVMLWRYKSQPGSVGAVPERWPAQSAVTPSTSVPTLVMFAHPRCPCSRASLTELAIVVSRELGHVDVHVLFDKPEGEGDDWTDTDLWRSAAAMPGVSVAVDPEGATAHRFGAETSGWVVLYDPSGRLLFAGGITSARGHEGDSEGRRAVLALLDHRSTGRTRAPVFGCSLDAPELAEENRQGGKEARWTQWP